ncbi:MAG: hypothetical protein ACYTG0_38645 [Planctomycetota bacterium]
MPSEPFTTDELVTLAEACGKESITVASDGTVMFDHDEPEKESGGGWEDWQPHIDANQRDELVNTMHELFGDIELYVVNNNHSCKVYDDGNVCVAWAIKATTGEAVCRAALKAIKRAKKCQKT